jgi:hypothetical protein
MRATVGQFALLVSLMTGVAVYASASTAASNVNDLTFADSDWDQNILNAYSALEPELVELGTDFAIAPPALNDSDETLAELDVLRGLVAQRSDDLVAQVGADYGHAPDGVDLSYELSNPLVLQVSDEALITDVQGFAQKAAVELIYFVMVEKQRFARVRPSVLADDLSAAIDAPSYPAYPAEVAANAQLFANVLGYVDPSAADDYKTQAQVIARRSEIAGLHFPSDSAAGVKIADEYFDLLLQNPDAKSAIDGFRDALSEKG